MKTLTIAAISSLVLLMLIPSAHAGTPAKSIGYSDTQVDGIISSSVDDLWSRTDFWWHKGEYSRIIADDRLITEADPHFLQPYSIGGWLLESKGDNSDAEKYYRLGAVRNPDKTDAWFVLGFFYYNTMKNYPEAIKTFTAAANAPDGDKNAWKMLAHSYERNKQLTDAVTVWQKLQKTYPADALIVYNLDKDQKELSGSAAPVSQ